MEAYKGCLGQILKTYHLQKWAMVLGLSYGMIFGVGNYH